MSNKYKEVAKIMQHVEDIETTCAESTVKQIVCILISRLLNPETVQETAGLMAGLADAEEKAMKDFNIKDLH